MAHCVIVLVAFTAVARGADTAPTIKQWLSLSTVMRPRISPDGQSVVYEREDTTWQDNGYRTQLILTDIRTGRSIPLMAGDHSGSDAQWSSDGRWIAFLAEAAGTRQIWLASAATGTSRMLTAHAASIRAMRWSPDGSRIAFLATAPSAAKSDRDYDVFEHDFAQSQLWIADVSAAEEQHEVAPIQQVTFDRNQNVGPFDWSPDGKQIAFGAWPDPLDEHFGRSAIFVVDLSTRAVTPVVTAPGLNWNPHFSPDGKCIAFGTFLGKTQLYASEHIALLDRQTRVVRDLTASFDEDTKIIAYTRTGIYFRALQRTASHLFRLDPNRGAIGRVSSPDPAMLNDISVSYDGKFVAYAAPDASHLTEIYVSPTEKFAPKRITDSSSQLRGWTLGSVELVRWSDPEGVEIEGVLRKPPNFDAGTRYPLVVIVHGGPNGLARPELGFSRYPIQQLLAKGALILEPNYRGSAGYGTAFRAASVGKIGAAEMDDILSGANALIKRGIVDADRMGVAGWSHGGFVAAYLATHTARFRAISAGAAIADWRTFYAAFPPGPLAYIGAKPSEDPAAYAKASPITAVENAKTPTLIQHGERDSLVPVINAYMLYRGLVDAGVATTLITFPAYGHGIGRPRAQEAEIQQNYDWFSHYLWGD